MVRRLKQQTLEKHASHVYSDTKILQSFNGAIVEQTLVVDRDGKLHQLKTMGNHG